MSSSNRGGGSNPAARSSGSRGGSGRRGRGNNTAAASSSRGGGSNSNPAAASTTGGGGTNNDPSPASSSEDFFRKAAQKKPMPTVPVMVVDTGGAGDEYGQHQLRHKPKMEHSVRVDSGFAANVSPGAKQVASQTSIAGHTSPRVGFIIAEDDASKRGGKGGNQNRDSESSPSEY